jgi:hypothetical protein
MDHRLSFASTSGGSRLQRRRVDIHQPRRKVRGSTVNYPGNPRFCPRLAFKYVGTSEEMEQRKRLLENHVVVITEEGPLGVRSREEVKDIISLNFGISKHNFYVYHTRAGPFLAFFHGTQDNDVVFVAARAVDGPTDLSFIAWELDRFGDGALFPYHVRMNIEGIPHHAWYQDIAQKKLCDEAIICHVDEDIERGMI